MRRASTWTWLGFAVLVVLTGCANTSRFPKAQPDKASDINLELGIDHLRKGKLSEAKEKIERSLSQNPRNANAHATAGLLYSHLGEVDKADSHFERAVALDGENPEILNSYAAFLCSHEHYERGEKVALKAAENQLYKTPEVAYMNAGNCARNAGNLKSAEDSYRMALKARPRLATALFQLADVEYTKKEYLSARGFLERYLATARPSPSGLWLAVRIERGLGNVPAATEYARRLRNDFPNSAEAKALLESERQPG